MYRRRRCSANISISAFPSPVIARYAIVPLMACLLACAVSRVPAAVAPPPSVAPVIAEAEALVKEGNFAEAVKRLGARLMGMPDTLKAERRAVSVALADTHSHWGKSLANRADYAAAIEQYELAAALDRLYRRAYEGADLSNMGRAYWNLGQYEKAANYYEQALVILREVKNRPGEGATLNNLGLAYAALNQYAKAIGHSEQALLIAREDKNRVGEAITLENLGRAYWNLSRYEKAVSYYEQALLIARENKDRAGESGLLTSLGLAYAGLGRYEKAVSVFERTLTRAQEDRDRSGEAIALNNQGAAYLGLGQPEKAMSHFGRSLMLYREDKARSGEGRTLNNLGGVSWYLGQHEKALSYYEQALVRHREMRDRSGEAISLSNLSFLWQSPKNPQRNAALAIFYGKQAINLAPGLPGNLQALDKDLQHHFLSSHDAKYRSIAALLIEQGRLSEAQQVLGLLKEQEFFAFARRDVSIARDKGRADLTAREALWEKRYRQIGDDMIEIGRKRAVLLARQQNRTEADKAQLLTLSTEMEASASVLQKFLEELTIAFVTAPAAGGSALDRATLSGAEGLQATLRDLGQNSVALYALVGPDKLCLLVVTPDALIAREYAITAADLNRKVAAFRAALQDPRRDPRPLARELHDILIAPIQQDLDGANAKTLMWSLDGALRYLPVAALHDGKQYLIEKYRSSVFTPAAMTRLTNAPRPAWSALALGVSRSHVIDGIRMEPPPSALREIAALVGPGSGAAAEKQTRPPSRPGGAGKGILSGVALLDEAFTEKTLIPSLRQGFPFVHIAAPVSLVPGDETASFLVLGDGTKLTPAMIKTMPGIFEAVGLLTLSASGTTAAAEGINDGKNGSEVENFSVLAQKKGADAVLASLWPVADAASTEALMRAFYTARQKSTAGIDKAEALRQAQLFLLYGKAAAPALSTTETTAAAAVVDPANSTADSSSAGLFTPDPAAPFSHPFYWAPFVLTGNWK